MPDVDVDRRGKTIVITIRDLYVAREYAEAVRRHGDYRDAGFNDDATEIERLADEIEDGTP